MKFRNIRNISIIFSFLVFCFISVQSYGYEATTDANNPMSPLFNMSGQDYEPVGLNKIFDFFSNAPKEPKTISLELDFSQDFDLNVIGQKRDLLDKLSELRESYDRQKRDSSPFWFIRKYVGNEYLYFLWGRRIIEGTEYFGFYLLNEKRSIFVTSTELNGNNKTIEDIFKGTEKQLLLNYGSKLSSEYIQFYFEGNTLSSRHYGLRPPENKLSKILENSLFLERTYPVTEPEAVDILSTEWTGMNHLLKK